MPGVKTIDSEYGSEILTAVTQNDLARLKAVMTKRFKTDSKIKQLCESSVQHRPTKTVACPLILAVRLPDPTILRWVFTV
jgi:hypothetical protein